MTRSATRFPTLIADGSKRGTYHRPDLLVDGHEPSCPTSRKADGGWRPATEGELTFLDPCTHDACFGAQERGDGYCASCDAASRDCYRCEHCGRDLAGDASTEGRA